MSDDPVTSIAHLVLCGVAGTGLSRFTGKSFTHPGMHINFLIHGLTGAIYYSSSLFGVEISSFYFITLSAAKYLALPCLMADVYNPNTALQAVHLISGIVPFVMDLTGNSNSHVGNIVIALNIISLCHYSMTNNKEWGWYTAGAALFAYFAAPNTGVPALFPLGLALMEFCAFKFYHQHDAPPDTGRRRR